MSLNEKMTAIADAIRIKTGETEPLNLETMALEVPKVYNKGYESGKEKEWSDFWDNLQKYGERTFSWSSGFKGWMWNDNIFKPKYDIYYGPQAFQECNIRDLKGLTNGRGLKCVPLSATTSLDGTFRYSSCEVIPDLTTEGWAATASQLTSTFRDMPDCHTIEGITSTETAVFNNAFTNSPKIANITWHGVIGNNIDFASCPLTIDSCKSIIIGFIINETISIIENAGLMGLPLPGILNRAIEMLRDMERGADENN